MLEQMLMTHSILIKAFLGFLVLGLFIPQFAGKDGLKFKKASFIYTMVFQAIATMIAFAGLVAMVSGNLGMTVTTIIMIIVWAIMMFLEIKKHKSIKKSDLSDEATFTASKSSFMKVNVIQILILVAMVVMMVLRAKGVISI